jgi:hypothetical protein
VSAIGHFLESEGIATASISLVREHTDVMRPPRALWVPFPLGRPLGAAHHVEFQRRVLRALLELFERPSGPVLEDFPDDAPDDGVLQGADQEGDACPVFFDEPAPTADGERIAALLDEIARLEPWQAVAARRRGGSAFGLSGQPASVLARRLIGLLGAPSTTVADWQTIKLAVDDLRTFYEEAASAQPAPFAQEALQRWFYRQTLAGELVQALRQAGLAHAEAGARQIADRMLIPRRVLVALSSGG